MSGLSHGLPALTVSGNNIVNAETGEPVRLRGVNRSGLEYSSHEGAGSLAKAGITEEEITEITGNWKANVIRLPFNQDWALSKGGYDPRPYRNAIESVIEMAAAHGAYTLLDLQWLDHQTVRGTAGGQPNFVAPLPNTDSITLWRQLSTLWCDETAILYDIFNEPHDRLPDDAQPLLGIRDDLSTFELDGRVVGPSEWLPWARQLVAAIRSGNPNALIFVPGVNWAFNLQGCVMPDVEGVVYSTHIYVKNGGGDPTEWDQMFGAFGESVPVFAGEFGGCDNEVNWGEELVDYFDELAMGWTAWSWSDDPRLIKAVGAVPFEPTLFGTMVQKRLASPRKQ